VTWPHVVRRARAVVAVTALAAATAFAAEGPAAPPAGDPIALPLTLGKVWYRTEKRGWGGLKTHRLTGDITLTAERLDFVAKKDAVSVKVDSISMISLGKMSGDVNTLWVVLDVVEAGTRRTIGFRDGGQLGYGQRTEEMYHTLRGTLRQLGTAQFAARAGYQPFTVLDQEFALSFPEDWSVHTVHLATSGGSQTRAELIFSPQPIGPREDVERARRGGVPGFFVSRERAPRGTDCDGFSPAATTTAVEHLAEELQVEAGWEIVEPPHAEPVEIGGCQGLRMRGGSRGPDGAELRIDRRAVAKRNALLLLDLRSAGPADPDLLARFEGSVESVKFAAAER